MKGLFLGFAIIAAAGAHAQSLFYGGDMDGANGFLSQRNGQFYTDARSYDDFTVFSPVLISSVFANFQDNSSFRGSQVFWEVRSGTVGGNPGNPGTFVIGGTASATAAATGRFLNQVAEYTYEAQTGGVWLDAGTYHMTVAVIGGDGGMYITSTSGANGVGSPLGNGGALLDIPEVSTLHYRNISDLIGGGSVDLSIGFRGQPVPEPMSMAVLGVGALALIRMRRK